VVVAEGGDARQDAVVEDDLAAVLADAGVGPARRLLRVRDDGRVDDLGRGIRQRWERAGVATAWSKPPSPLVLRSAVRSSEPRWPSTSSSRPVLLRRHHGVPASFASSPSSCVAEGDGRAVAVASDRAASGRSAPNIHAYRSPRRRPMRFGGVLVRMRTLSTARMPRMR
jgi:hypothetical protein